MYNIKVEEYSPEKIAAFRKVLQTARKLIAKGWTKEAYARTKTGRVVNVNSRAAAKFCALGAISKAAWKPKNVHYGIGGQVMFLLQDVLHLRGESYNFLGSFNDRQKTKKPVLALFDEALVAFDSYVKESEAKKSSAQT